MWLSRLLYYETQWIQVYLISTCSGFFSLGGCWYVNGVSHLLTKRTSFPQFCSVKFDPGSRWPGAITGVFLDANPCSLTCFKPTSTWNYPNSTMNTASGNFPWNLASKAPKKIECLFKKIPTKTLSRRRRDPPFSQRLSWAVTSPRWWTRTCACYCIRRLWSMQMAQVWHHCTLLRNMGKQSWWSSYWKHKRMLILGSATCTKQCYNMCCNSSIYYVYGGGIP